MAKIQNIRKFKCGRCIKQKKKQLSDIYNKNKNNNATFFLLFIVISI